MADQRLDQLTEIADPADTDLLYLVTSGSPSEDRRVTVANLRGSRGGDPADTIITPDTYANLPAAGTAGRVYLPTDSFYLLRDSGAAWVPWGPIFPMTQPVLGDFAWINQGGATASSTNGGIHIAAPAGAGDSVRLLKKSAPATPYTVTAALLPLLDVGADNSAAGLAFRQSSDGKLVTFGFQVVGGSALFVFQNWNSPTSFSAVFLNNRNDGTNRTFSFSVDGVNFLTPAATVA